MSRRAPREGGTGAVIAYAALAALAFVLLAVTAVLTAHFTGWPS